jgi:hypothetical protein
MQIDRNADVPERDDAAIAGHIRLDLITWNRGG